MLHHRLVEIERARVVGGLELVQGHAKLPAGSLIEHLAALLAGQLDNARFGGDRVHSAPRPDPSLLTVCIALMAMRLTCEVSFVYPQQPDAPPGPPEHRPGRAPGQPAYLSS
jgi:hypothetical protein